MIGFTTCKGHDIVHGLNSKESESLKFNAKSIKIQILLLIAAPLSVA